MAVRAQHYERRAVESAQATFVLEECAKALKTLPLATRAHVQAILAERTLGGQLAGIVADAWALAVAKAEGRS